MSLPKEYSDVFSFLGNHKLLFFRTVLRLSSKRSKVLRVVLIDPEGNLLMYSTEGEAKRKIFLGREVTAVYADSNCVDLHIEFEHDLALEFHPSRSNLPDANIRRFLQVLAAFLPPEVQINKTKRAFDHIHILDADKARQMNAGLGATTASMMTSGASEAPGNTSENEKTPNLSRRSSNHLMKARSQSLVSTASIMPSKEADHWKHLLSKDDPSTPKDSLHPNDARSRRASSRPHAPSIAPSTAASPSPTNDFDTFDDIDLGSPAQSLPNRSFQSRQSDTQLQGRNRLNSMASTVESPKRPVGQSSFTDPNLIFSSSVRPQRPPMDQQPERPPDYTFQETDPNTEDDDALLTRLEAEVEIQRLEALIDETRRRTNARLDSLEALKAQAEANKKHHKAQVNLASLVLLICRQQRLKAKAQSQSESATILRPSSQTVYEQLPPGLSRRYDDSILRLL